MPVVWVQFWEAIMQKYFAQAFQNDHNNIWDAVQWDKSAGK